VRFVQASDIHIGESRTLPNYLERHAPVLWQIQDRCIQERLPLILPGDVFHTKTPTFEERLLADRFFGRCEAEKIPTIVTPGNHDHLYGEVTLLDGYKHYPLTYVKIVTYKPEVAVIGDTAFICVGWGNYSKDDLEQIVRGFLPGVMQYKYRVALVHECIVGSRFDNGLVSPKGSSLPNISEITYWAVGDIHTFQPTNLPNGFYAGAPLQFRFDDQQTKGYLVVDLDHPTNPTFVPSQFRKLKTVDSVDQIIDDSYYMVRGGMDEVLKGNKLDNVLRTDYEFTEKTAISYTKLSITDGLPEFLALHGFDNQYQERAVKWVNKSLNQTGA